MSTTVEVIRRIWNDREGVCLEIGRDEHGAMEVRTPDEASKRWFGDVQFSLPSSEFTMKFADALGLAGIEMEKDEKALKP
ncbi:hypothetical protein ISN75_06675 [Dyella marensis]|uniref:hypothetical protein n=1 Tax=Dyella marensis TaxID=500610 RepID=UPI0031D5D991